MEAASLPQLASGPDRLSWDEFADEFVWNQGEHVTLVGPTGRGKTTLALAILPLQRYTVAFVTKRRDPVLAQLRQQGFVTFKDWAITDTNVAPKVVLAPELKHGVKSLKEQRGVFERALRTVYVMGGWTLYLDEARYITEYLKLDDECELLWQQGRSLGVSVVCACQRPYYIPQLAFDQATHIFIWKETDKRTLQRIDEIGGGFDADDIRQCVRSLDKHECLYVNTLTERRVITQAPKEA